jgi:hypothetical protein
VPELPAAFVAHTTPRRLRIKIPSKRGNRAYFNNLMGSFSDLEGIEELRVNPATGSILFIHELEVPRIIAYATAKGSFALLPGRPYPANIRQRLSKTIQDSDRVIRNVTGDEVDMGSLTFLVLIAAGIYQIGRGNLAAIPWYTALWYGSNVFWKTQPAA